MGVGELVLSALAIQVRATRLYGCIVGGGGGGARARVCVCVCVFYTFFHE